MELGLILLIGLLVACGSYLVLEGNRFCLLIGIAILSNAANLLVFTSAGLGEGSDAIVDSGEVALAATAPDPLAQAMVLTAIVIGFAVLAFCLVLTVRASEEGELQESEVDE